MFTKEILVDDCDVVIFGYPTEYILTFLKNNQYFDLNEVQQGFTFQTDSALYSHITFKFELDDQFQAEDLMDSIKQVKNIYLSRNIFFFKDDTYYGEDFIDEELSIKNNILINYKLDRLISFVQIKVPLLETKKQQSVIGIMKMNSMMLVNPSKDKDNYVNIYTNKESLDIPETHKIALKNMLNENKVGIYSILWEESIEDKIKNIIKTKFQIIYYKIMVFLSLPEDILSVISLVRDEICQEKENKKQDFYNQAKQLLSNYKSHDLYYSEKNHMNSDNDLLVEANRKSPVILVIGKPFIGKTAICKKLCKELDLVYISPENFINNKVLKSLEKFNEANDNFVEEPVDEMDGMEVKDKQKRPQVKDFMTEIEYMVYSDLFLNSGELSIVTLGKLYNYLINLSEGFSKGSIIEHCYYRFDLKSELCYQDNLKNMNLYSGIENKSGNNIEIVEHSPSNEGSLKKEWESNNQTFENLLLNGHFGNVHIDYFINLTLNEEEDKSRIEGIRYYIKTGEKLTKRELEIMLNPTKPKKEIYPDEEIDEENIDNEQPEALDEELIPKDDDFIDIIRFDYSYSNLVFQYKTALEVYKAHYKNLTENDSYFIENKIPNRQCYTYEIDISGLDDHEIIKLLKNKLVFTKYSRYIAKSLEGSSHKNLLMDGREGIVPFRKWSMWKDYDPVSLKNNFLILKGNPEFAAEYCGRVFIFINEENKNMFIENPKYFVNKQPQLPSNYRIAIFGPPKSGKKTIASMLNEMFKFNIINIDDIANAVVEWQKNLDEHIVNSRFYSKVHFALEEFKEITIKKKPIEFYSKIIFMLDFLGIPLNRKCTYDEEKKERELQNEKLNRILNPPSRKRIKKKEIIVDQIEEPEDNRNIENNEEKIDEQPNNDEDQDQINQNADNIEDILDDTKEKVEIEEWETDTQYVDPYPPEEEYTLTELKSNQFYYAYDQDYKYPRPGGFVLLNHPSTEEEIQKFKEFNIVFDKIIYLTDESEEPLKELMIRNKPDFSKLDEEKQQAEIAKMQDIISKQEEILNILRNVYNVNEEDCVVKINLADNINLMKEKLYNSLNPFSTQIDDEEKCYNASDVGAEKIKMPFGEFGKYCPVTYHEDNWLISGSQEEELTVNHRKYLFASKKEQELFKLNPLKYLKNMNFVKVPTPKIFVLGTTGSGCSSLINKLSNDYKLSLTNLKNAFVEIWERTKNERKQIRIDKKRKQLIIEQEEKKKEKLADTKENDKNDDPDAEQEPDIEEILKNDQALDEEEEDFNATEHNKNIFKSLFFANKPSIFNSKWFEMNEKVPMSFSELLLETKKTPDVIISIKTSLKSTIERIFNEKEIKDKHKILENESIERKKEAFQKLKDEKIKEQEDKIKEEYNIIESPTEEETIKYESDLLLNRTSEPEISEEEKDNIFNAQDDLLPELNEMINKEKDKLIQTYESENAFIAEFIESIKLRVPIIELDNNKPFDLTIRKLYNLLEPYIHLRDNLIEKMLCNYIGEQSTEEEIIDPKLSLRKLNDLENSHTYINGSFGKLSVISPEKYLHNQFSTNYPVVYRDKLYYFNNFEERDKFLSCPIKYSQVSKIRHDILFNKREIIFVIGDIQSGKSILSNSLSTYGYYCVNVSNVVKELLEKLSKYSTLRKEIEQTVYAGETLHDNLIIRAINRRITMSDLCNKNIVFDGIPYTQSQIKDLESCGIIPDLVINLVSDKSTILKRCFKRPEIYGFAETIVENIENNKFHYDTILSNFFTRKYKIINIDSTKSTWHNESLLMNYLENKKKQTIQMTANYNENKPTLFSHLMSPFFENLVFSSLDDFYFYSPISLRKNTHFYFNKYFTDFTVYYKNKFFFLSNLKEFELFNTSPEIYYNYLKNTKFDIIPPELVTYENLSDQLADIDNSDNKSEDDDHQEKLVDEKKNNIQFQGCCPVAFNENGKILEGNILNCCSYKGKYYTMSSYFNTKKFLVNPEKYIKIVIPVKTFTEINKGEEKMVDFTNTVNYLETNFGTIITKGMLELSKNRIKYPFIDTKESSIKYLALFLKSNNIKNNDYAKFKYTFKLNKFLQNSQLPFDLLKIYEDYQQAEEGSLKKKLLFRELDKLAVQYDELLEEAKIQKNVKFDGFFNDL